MGMTSSGFVTEPKWLVWCMEKEDGFIMMGSRKINQLDVQVSQEFDTLYDTLFMKPIFLSRTYMLSGQFGGFIAVVAPTEFEAFTSLMSALREEERKEEEEKARLQAQREERQREADEITDNDWGDYDDWDYYEDDIY